MKLKLKRLTLENQINEFDNWVTPTLGEIKDTDKFVSEKTSIAIALETLGSKTNNFETLDGIRPESLAESIIGHLTGKSLEGKVGFLRSVFSLFFLVTGKSDNNCKCQFPIYLRDTLRIDGFPRIIKKGGDLKLVKGATPRILDDEFLSKHICALSIFPKAQLNLLSQYVDFLLNDSEYIKSFWAIGNTYFRMKELGLSDEFLMPLIVYRVRGSVSASGGHEPEELLRDRMKEWGLLPNIDFNMADVIIGKQKEQNKTQTRASRTFTLSKYKKAQFVEYLDGAGYFGSLNGDLRSILSMKDTKEFFQTRTSVIKLRSLLQEIGFLTPLEVIHAWSLSNGNESQIRSFLLKEGYNNNEVERVIQECFRRNILNIKDGIIEVDAKLKEISRRYLLLDFIAHLGIKFDKSKSKGTLIVPGFGPNFGVSLSSVADNIIPKSGIFGFLWAKNGLILKDIEFLTHQGWIIQQ